jgi:hypothetical protein
MTREELDTLWDKSVNESIKAGDGLARYRYAEYVAAAAKREPEHIHTCGPDCQKPLCVNRRREIAAAVEAEREACAEYAAVLAEAGWSAWSIAEAIRARGSK